MARTPLSYNVLYLHSHDTGRYVEPYGFAVHTPHLQALAREGVLFRQAFSAAPTCSPSRAALLTGQYPHCCGMHGLASPRWGYRLDAPERLLPRFLQAAHYQTAIVGVQHVTEATPEGLTLQGYDRFLQDRDLGEDVADTEILAERFLRENHDRPWFLSVGFDETHRDSRMGDPESGRRFSKHFAYDPESLDASTCRGPAIYPDLPEIRRDFASYRVGVRRLDERIGHVLAALAASGQNERTVVIATTDHGLAWPGMKGTLTDHGVGVMLILRGPEGLSGGKAIDAPVSQMDLFPTLCALLKLPAPDYLMGKSLLPLIAGDQAQLHSELFFEHSWHEVADPQRAVRTERYKLIVRFGPRRLPAANCDESPTKRMVRQLGWFEPEHAAEELFDLALDPLERCDRSADPELALEKARLRAALDRWMEATDDPLLSGHAVPPPAQAAPARSLT